MNKDIKLKMSVLDENGKLVEIPENIQKHIEAREKFWVDKIKDIDSKCGIVLERLALTEKALELACEKIDAEYMNGIYCTEYPDYFRAKAKEMLKDENN